MLGKLFTRLKTQPPAAQAVILVSGLPRSGTSMMMQMLQAGGLPVLTDRLRCADDDNPRGYYELEQVKKLKEGDFSWLPEAGGKVVKVISALLEYLPSGYAYKVIFMQREMGEILASQKQMLVRRNEPTDKVSDEALAEYFRQHLESVKAWLDKQKNIDVLYLAYANLLDDPAGAVEKIQQFLKLPLQVEAMLAVPDRSLHRQRK